MWPTDNERTGARGKASGESRTASAPAAHWSATACSSRATNKGRCSQARPTHAQLPVIFAITIILQHACSSIICIGRRSSSYSRWESRAPLWHGLGLSLSMRHGSGTQSQGRRIRRSKLPISRTATSTPRTVERATSRSSRASFTIAVAIAVAGEGNSG